MHLGIVQFNWNSSAESDVNSTLQIRTWKWCKKRKRFLVSKVVLKFEISCGIKILPVDPGFSNWESVIKKAPIINCFKNSKSLKGIFFSLKFES